MVDEVSRLISYFKKYVPVFIILLGMGFVFATGLHEFLTFENLKQNRLFLQEFSQENLLLTVVSYCGIYIITVVFSIPGASLLTITGGFLLGQWVGCACVVFSATIGATLLFLAARTALGNNLKEKAAPWFSKLEKGFQKNAFNYLLIIRLIPLFPFFIVNLVPAFLGMHIRPYVLATFFGIIPGSFVYTSVGVGLGSIFDRGETFSVKSVMTPEIFLALLGLAALSILPLLYKKFKQKS